MTIAAVPDPTPLTIEEAQNSIKSTLLKLAGEAPERVRAFLCPDGYDLVVELQEEGRKKRRNASSENWSPEKGELFIYFEKRAPSLAPDQATAPVLAPTLTAESATSNSASGNPVTQLATALQEVEKTRDFVALKWFRDEVLPSRNFAWARNATERQSVMRDAIEAGYVLTSRVHNPHAPQYPTTTIRANRTKIATNSDAPATRFRPVPVRGEPVSVTLLRERGPR